MTTAAPRTAPRSATIISRVGVVLAALLALLEAASTIPNIGGAAPLPLDITTIILDVATLVGVYPAFRGRTWGLWLVIISRAITFLPTLPVFFVPEAAAFLPTAIVALSVTLVAIVLTAFGLRKRA
jgi:hypothetical protein